MDANNGPARRAENMGTSPGPALRTLPDSVAARAIDNYVGFDNTVRLIDTLVQSTDLVRKLPATDFRARRMVLEADDFSLTEDKPRCPGLCPSVSAEKGQCRASGTLASIPT
jgi:hypothetical protein